jgi:hypothetical protein
LEATGLTLDRPLRFDLERGNVRGDSSTQLIEHRNSSLAPELADGLRQMPDAGVDGA